MRRTATTDLNYGICILQYLVYACEYKKLGQRMYHCKLMVNSCVRQTSKAVVHNLQGNAKIVALYS